MVRALAITRFIRKKQYNWQENWPSKALVWSTAVRVLDLMGLVADTIVQHGGQAVGVIPEFMLDYEIAHSNLTELHVVKSMHERKAMMADRASAFVALPGGLGTFEEILEIATWGQLNQHQKPMILYNVNGFYDAADSAVRPCGARRFFTTTAPR